MIKHGLKQAFTVEGLVKNNQLSAHVYLWQKREYYAKNIIGRMNNKIKKKPPKTGSFFYIKIINEKPKIPISVINNTMENASMFVL